MMNAREIKTSRRILPFVCVLLAAHFLLTYFAGSIDNHRFLFLFFFFTLVLLPGSIATSIIFPEARVYYKLLLSLIFGTVQIFIFLLIFSIFSLDIFYVSILVPVLCLALAVFKDRGSFSGFYLPDNQPLSRTVIVIMLIIIALVSILTLGIGDALFYTSDAQDHIAYIRAISRSHEAFPGQFIYKDGGMLTRDIRKGLLHSMWGTVNLLTSRTEVYPVWPLISWIGSLFLLLGIFCLGIQLFKSQSIAILGVILYILFFQRGLAGHHIITAAYGFHFGKIYLYAFLISALLYIKTSRNEFLAMAAASSFGATGTHISYFLIMFFVMFILIIMEWFQSDEGSRKVLLARSAPILLGATFIVNMPYLLIRYFRDYSPGNEIHTHVQGMLFLGEDLAVLNPILFFQSDGILMAIAFIAILILWKRSRDNGNLRLMLGLAAVVFILVFNPLWVPFIMDRITYLLVRFSVAAPTMLIAAYLLHTLWQRMRSRIDYPSRGTAIIGSLVVIVLLLPPLLTNFTEFAYGGSHRRMRECASALNLTNLYAELEDNIPAGSVIASDPLTSYCLLAFTDHYVVCTYDQHSTPNDSTALDRIMACRDICLPYTSCEDIAGTLEKSQAEYVVINGRIPKRVGSKYWKPDRESAEATARKLSDCNGLFEPIYFRNSVYIFRYLGTSGEISEGVPTPPSEIPGFIKGEFSGDYADMIESGVDGIYLNKWGKKRDSVARGDTLTLYVEWVAESKKEFGNYVIYIRFDTDFEKGPLFSPRYGKIYRKMVEKIKGERYRFRMDKLPFEGIYPPDKWPTGKMLTEHFKVPIPRDIAAGTYTISIKMDNAPHVSNLRMKDLLRDDDFYDGPDLMEVIIE